MDTMAAQDLKKLPDILEAIDADAARLHHLTAAALTLLDELPFTDANGTRIRAMDQLWAVLSSMEIQARLLDDCMSDAIAAAKSAAKAGAKTAEAA